MEGFLKCNSVHIEESLKPTHGLWLMNREMHTYAANAIPHRNTSGKLSFHLGITLKACNKQSHKTPWCSCCNVFLRTLFTVSQYPFYEDSKEEFFSGLCARNNWASSKQQVSFLFIGTEQLVSPNIALFSLTALKLKSQVCGLPQANVEALMALLNSSHVSFFCFHSFSSPPLSIYFLLQFI